MATLDPEKRSNEVLEKAQNTPKKSRYSDEIPFVDLQKLKILFTQTPIVDLQLIKEEEIPKPTEFINAFTPETAKIYEYLPAIERDEFLKQVQKDNEIINRIDNQMDVEYNPLYLSPDYLENLVSFFFKCPGCGKVSLKKYLPKNMPVIDVVCINTLHPSNRTRFFQIKTTENGKKFKDSEYFSKSDRYIHVGSQIYGFNAHKVSSIDDKEYLIGYICINYTLVGDRIRINKSKSFYLNPNIGEINRETIFYEYIEENKISFNIIPSEITDLIDKPLFERDLTFFESKPYENTLFDPEMLKLKRQLIFENKKKYMKYKKKYFILKKMMQLK